MINWSIYTIKNGVKSVILSKEVVYPDRTKAWKQLRANLSEYEEIGYGCIMTGEFKVMFNLKPINH